MNYSSVANVFGTLLIVIGSSMLLPAVCSIYYREDDLNAIVVSSFLIICLGIPLRWIFRNHHLLNIRDGLFIATFGWIAISAFSAIPFMIHGSIPSLRAECRCLMPMRVRPVPSPMPGPNRAMNKAA
ncbi:MAG: hypothetical protein HQL90_01015 [Magnetococcales bacterium]|nr:hypothetical protein [Magnetococcales bacterium]